MKQKQLTQGQTKQPFSQLLLRFRIFVFVGLVAVIGGSVLLRSSFAASVTVSGWVYDSRTNKGIPNVHMNGCGVQFNTDSTGHFSFPVATTAYYCARVLSGIPSGWSGPVTNNQPDVATAKTYENQVPAKNCYHNTSCPTVTRSWDRAVDTGFNFRYTSPAPPTISSFSASPSTITVGSSSKLAWVSNGTGCSLVYGSTHTNVSASGSTTVKPGSTTSYALTCSNTSGNSPSKSVTITVKSTSKTTQPPGNGGGSGTTQIGTGTTPDKTPPTIPLGITATEDSTSKMVIVSWQKSTDNVGVAGYKLERSIDNKTWASLDIIPSTTSFEDKNTTFSTLYYYRVKAVDKAGNSSGYASAQITTSAFQANTSSTDTTSITSEDKLITVIIPGEILSTNAFCSLTAAEGVLPPNITGYITVAGPYQLTCRDAKGQPITNFNGSLLFNTQFDSNTLKSVGQVEYFGQKSDDSWQPLEIRNHDKKSRNDSVSLNDFTVFSIMGQQGKHSIWLKLVEILVILALLIFGTIRLLRFIVVRRALRQAQKLNDDYRHKSGGY